jgi:hypothetical protein
VTIKVSRGRRAAREALAGKTYANLIPNDIRQVLRVGQISIVRHANPVGEVGVEGLGFGTGTGPSCRVPDMSDAHVASQFHHVMRLEDVLDQTVVLAQVQTTALGRDNASGILAPMLQDGQPVKEQLVDLKESTSLWVVGCKCECECESQESSIQQVPAVGRFPIPSIATTPIKINHDQSQSSVAHIHLLLRLPTANQ